MSPMPDSAADSLKRTLRGNARAMDRGKGLKVRSSAPYVSRPRRARSCLSCSASALCTTPRWIRLPRAYYSSNGVNPRRAGIPANRVPPPGSCVTPVRQHCVTMARGTRSSVGDDMAHSAIAECPWVCYKVHV